MSNPRSEHEFTFMLLKLNRFIFYLQSRKKFFPGADAGFSLLEVLVALAIAGLGLGLLFDAYAGGVRTARDLEARDRALIRARSILATVDAEPRLAPGRREGAGWWLEIDPVASDDGLMALDLSVDWQTGGRYGTVRLHTYRLSREGGG